VEAPDGTDALAAIPLFSVTKARKVGLPRGFSNPAITVNRPGCYDEALNLVDHSSNSN
jgi:hypothetical protein